MCYRDIFESDVEFLCALEQIAANAVADGFTLCDEFGGVELCDDRLEDFVTNGWKDTLIVIRTKILISLLMAISI